MTVAQQEGSLDFITEGSAAPDGNEQAQHPDRPGTGVIGQDATMTGRPTVKTVKTAAKRPRTTLYRMFRDSINLNVA